MAEKKRQGTGGAMAVSVAKVGNNSFRVQMGNTSVQLDRVELMKLSMAVDNALFPVAGAQRDEVDIQHIRLCLDRLAYADDAGVRELLRELSGPHLQVLVKFSEGNEALRGKLQANLPKRNWAMLQEDVRSRFKEPVSIVELNQANEEIQRVMGRLAETGELTLREPGDQQVKL